MSNIYSCNDALVAFLSYKSRNDTKIAAGGKFSLHPAGTNSMEKLVHMMSSGKISLIQLTISSFLALL